MEEKVSYVTIDNKTYLIVDEVTFNETKYLYLVNENDENDLLIQKVISENGEEYLTNLDSPDEVVTIMKIITNKHLKENE